MSGHTPFAASDATQKNRPGAEAPSPRNNMLHMPQTAETNNTPPTAFSDYHRAAMWLDGEVSKARKGVTTQVIDVTPALAEVLLERNPSNRKIRQALVDAFSRDMETGKWAFNGEPIILSADGFLNDGQHRCSAIVASGVAIPAVVVIGVARDTRTTIDQGAARTVGDYLGMEGHKDTNVLGAAATMCWAHGIYGAVSLGGRQRPTKSEILKFLEDHPSVAHSVTAVQHKSANAYGGKSLLAFCHWVFTRKAGAAVADQFMRNLLEGANLLSRDPVLYVRNRLVAERGNLKANDRAELLFRAWNAWRRGETPRTLLNTGGVLPVLED